MARRHALAHFEIEQRATGIHDAPAQRFILTLAKAVPETKQEAFTNLLDTLEEIAGEMDRRLDLPVRVPNGLIDLFRLFADGCHHAREGDLLFPALEDKRAAQQYGLVEAMLYEHDLGRSLSPQ